MNISGARLRDAFRTNLWPIPTLGVLAALVLGVVLPRVDRALDGRGMGIVFGGGADAASTVLDAIASSLITVTSLTFSLTVVTLQLASSQFSPRLLRTFTRDLVVQGTLAIFLGTFTFSLTVLRTVRTETGGELAFVPRLSVTVAYGLAIASVLALVFFLAHLTQTIRVESMLKSVHQGSSEVVRRVSDDDRITPGAARDLVPDGATPLLATSSGFLVDLDESDLVKVAVEHEAVVFIERNPGDSIIEGTPIGWVWNAASGPMDVDRCDELMAAVCSRITTGFERTSTSDLALGLRQLTDVAVKALSPGINDPTTAVHAIGHSSSLLCQLSKVPLGPRLLRDDDGAVRGVLSRPVFGDLLALAVEQPIHYGGTDPLVVARLLMLLREVAWTEGRYTNESVTTQLERFRRMIADTEFDPIDQATLEAEVDRVADAIEGRWDQTGRSH